VYPAYPSFRFCSPLFILETFGPDDVAALVEGLSLDEVLDYQPSPFPSPSPPASAFFTPPPSPASPLDLIIPFYSSPTLSPLPTYRDQGVQTEDTPSHIDRSIQANRNLAAWEIARERLQPITFFNVFLWYFDSTSSSPVIVPVTSVRLYFDHHNNIYEIHVRRRRDGRPHPRI
jgi:hypothetical protein